MSAPPPLPAIIIKLTGFVGCQPCEPANVTDVKDVAANAIPTAPKSSLLMDFMIFSYDLIFLGYKFDTETRSKIK